MTASRRLSPVEVAIVCAVAGLCFLFCLAPLSERYVLQLPTYLVVGWWFYLDRVVPQIEPDPTEFVTAAVALLIVLFGTHRFCRWLFAEWNKPADPPPVWPWRWTARLVGVVVLMFACGTAAVGVTHQAAWLLTSPEPIIRWGRWGAHPLTMSANNLKQHGLAAQDFHDGSGRLPAPTFSPDGRPLHSWHTALLPHIEQEAVHKKLRLDVPWDHADNRDATRAVIKPFLVPSPDLPAVPPGTTHYAPDARLFDKPHTLADFPSTSTTILAAEAVFRPKPWADPLNWRDPRLGANNHPDGFGGPWPDGKTVVVFLDGHVQTLTPAGWDTLLASGP